MVTSVIIGGVWLLLKQLKEIKFDFKNLVFIVKFK